MDGQTDAWLVNTIMTHLIWFYTVYPVVYEFLICYRLEETFLKFADTTFVLCFLGALRVTEFLPVEQILSELLKRPTKIAADDILIFYFYLSK